MRKKLKPSDPRRIFETPSRRAASIGSNRTLYPALMNAIVVVVGVEKPLGSRCTNSRSCSRRAARKPDVRSGIRCSVRKLASALSSSLPTRRGSVACVWPDLAPTTRSYSPICDTRRAASAGRCWPSPSSMRMHVPVAARMPLFTAAPLPLLYGCRTTRAPACVASALVPSLDPSSTTRISCHGAAALRSRTTAPIEAASLKAGITIDVSAASAMSH